VEQLLAMMRVIKTLSTEIAESWEMAIAIGNTRETAADGEITDDRVAVIKNSPVRMPKFPRAEVVAMTD